MITRVEVVDGRKILTCTLDGAYSDYPATITLLTVVYNKVSWDREHKEVHYVGQTL